MGEEVVPTELNRKIKPSHTVTKVSTLEVEPLRMELDQDQVHVHKLPTNEMEMIPVDNVDVPGGRKDDVEVPDNRISFFTNSPKQRNPPKLMEPGEGHGDELTKSASMVMGNIARSVMEGSCSMFQQFLQEKAEQTREVKGAMMSTSTTVQVRYTCKLISLCNYQHSQVHQETSSMHNF